MSEELQKLDSYKLTNEQLTDKVLIEKKNQLILEELNIKKTFELQTLETKYDNDRKLVIQKYELLENELKN